jgi:hypothetical protein
VRYARKLKGSKLQDETLRITTGSGLQQILGQNSETIHPLPHTSPWNDNYAQALSSPMKNKSVKILGFKSTHEKQAIIFTASAATSDT